jgi:uncharacterized lipoprotein YmbA
MTRRLAACAIMLLLAGCASAPTTYLTLAPVPGETVPGTGVVAVAPVQMPPALDRLRLTRAGGPEVIHVAPHTRWVAPLGGMIRRVLARDLAQRLPDAAVRMPGDPLPPGRLRLVRVNLLRFMPVTGSAVPAHVVLDADWEEATRRAGHRLVKGRTTQGRARWVVPAGAGGPAQAAAMSTALGRLADRIAATLGHLSRPAHRPAKRGPAAVERYGPRVVRPGGA